MLTFQIPQLDACRLWNQVSGGPRRVGSVHYSFYHTACLIEKTEGKRHHTEEFKDHISKCISSTIQCLQRKLCHNSNYYTIDHNCCVKYKLRERLGVQKLFFLALFVFKGWLGLKSGPMGISTFLPNKEQGSHVRNWATAMGQLTSRNPSYHLFTACLGNTPPLSSSIHGVGQAAFCKQI